MFQEDLIDSAELKILLQKNESHYLDFKSKEISGKDLQRHLTGFANSDGGEIYVGVGELGSVFVLEGFASIETANQLVQAALVEINPVIEGMIVDFLNGGSGGYLVRFVVPKSTKVHYTSHGDCYVRLSAQTQKIKAERIAALAYSKGFYRYEEQVVPAVDVQEILESKFLEDYLARLGSNQEAARFLRRNRLLGMDGALPVATVGCVLLFDSDPDEVLSTKASVKILRLKTMSTEYKREQLTHEKHSGPLERLIRYTEERILSIMQDASFEVDGVKFSVSYPVEAVHEVLVNAFLHRDYSISDEIQISIYDNRIEIRSPGRLPGGVTVNNILDSHFARNPNLVRLVNKLPRPLNHDLGEGLDTAFRAMTKAGLVIPKIEQMDDSVVVTLLHKRVSSYEEIIMGYLKEQEWITNKIARGLTGEGSENKVKKTLQALRKKGLIEPEDPDASRFNYRYRKAGRS